MTYETDIELHEQRLGLLEVGRVKSSGRTCECTDCALGSSWPWGHSARAALWHAGAAHLRQRGFGLGQPEGHLHGAV